MRFGICSKIDEAEALAEIGFDFVEWPVSSTVGTMDDTDFTALKQRVADWDIRPEAWNVLLPPTIRVVGPDADHTAMVDYLKKALPRVAELQGEVVVFGSGRSRRVPDGWSHDDALTQFAEACYEAGKVAAQSGVTITVEPLNRQEDNLLNTVADGLSVVNRVNHPSIQLLSDLYHVAQEDEPFEDTTDAGPRLHHVHVATKHDRALPLPGQDEGLLEKYFRALRAAGYAKRVSVEGKWDMEQLKDGLAYMRETWEKVSGESD